MARHVDQQHFSSKQKNENITCGTNRHVCALTQTPVDRWSIEHRKQISASESIFLKDKWQCIIIIIKLKMPLKIVLILLLL